MSVCLSCNKPLTDEEIAQVYEWGEEIELCGECLQDSEVEVIYNNDEFTGWEQ